MATSLPRNSNFVPGPRTIKTVCVFCGSGEGGDPIYITEATELGKKMAEKNYNLVYGGGSVGLMGAVAKAVIAGGAEAKGIIPEPLYRNGSKQICPVSIVPDMHARKKQMADESDAFVVLPGGFGTMEEMLEVITWSQLNIHSKPILLLNTKKYFDLFSQWIALGVKEKFIHETNASIFVLCDDAKDVIEKLNVYSAPNGRYALDWVTKDGQDGRNKI
ncbi:hypothetical protein CLU79DRAFT_733914 [Phycomyces nitens]|nr:hypothetical protein CLU79DRAFT_733914 [Phycomyces nitens]